MILVILKGSDKIQDFGNTYFEYGTGWLVQQDSGRQIYANKQNADIVEYTGDFPIEYFEPCKYLYKNGNITEDQTYIRPSKVTEYGVPEDVVEGIRQNATNNFVDTLIADMADIGYKE